MKRLRISDTLSLPAEAITESLDRERLAEETDYSPTSSGYANALGQLRTLGLVIGSNHEAMRLCADLAAAGGAS